MSFEESELFKAITEFSKSTPERVREILEKGENCDVNLKGSYNEGYLHVLSGPKSDDAVSSVICVIYMLSNAGIEVIRFIIHPCDSTVVICYLIWPCDIAVCIKYLISHSSSFSYNTVIKGYFRLSV